MLGCIVRRLTLLKAKRVTCLKAMAKRVTLLKAKRVTLLEAMAKRVTLLKGHGGQVWEIKATYYTNEAIVSNAVSTCIYG